MKTRLSLCVLVALVCAFVLVLPSGCSRLGHSVSNPLKWGSTKAKKDKKKKNYRVSLVRDYASVQQRHLSPVDGFGLVCGLKGTGAEEPRSIEREMILRELQKAEVDRPNELIDSKNTAIVRVHSFLPPGIQRGDRFDVKISVPPNSEVKSLRGGYLMLTNLQEMVIGGGLHTGDTVARVEGPVMLNPAANERTAGPMELVSGKILGGGIALRSRSLLLLMKDEHVSEYNTQQIATMINKRFYTRATNIGDGIATAKTDKTVELLIHPTYKDNIERYVRVISCIPVYERPEQRTERLEKLKKSILVPETARDSALQLEALGKQGIDVLKLGLESPNLEVRFYAAEALAYLNYAQAARPLAKIAKEEQAMRVWALAALSRMENDIEAEGYLRELLSENSAETRYGAFRALWARNPYDVAIRGEMLGRHPAYQFAYHVLNTQGPPMVHVTNNKRPELVLFNDNIRLTPDFVLDAGVSILVQSSGNDEVTVTRWSTQGMPNRRTVTTRLDEIVRAVADLGGTYPDVVQMLLEAQAQGALPCKLEVDKLPQVGEYKRPKNYSEDDDEEEKPKKSFWSRMNPSSWVAGGNEDANKSMSEDE